MQNHLSIYSVVIIKKRAIKRSLHMKRNVSCRYDDYAWPCIKLMSSSFSVIMAHSLSVNEILKIKINGKWKLKNDLMIMTSSIRLQHTDKDICLFWYSGRYISCNARVKKGLIFFFSLFNYKDSFNCLSLWKVIDSNVEATWFSLKTL